MFCDFFKKQLQSYRDLPLLYNQWANVIRWEKRTRPFLRTAEFHWQEGHTLHETSQEAYGFAKDIMQNVYIKIFQEQFAIAGIAGKKCESEKFAGAESTFTYESMMQNGWALQMCTSHVLGSGFMKQFEVSFLNQNGEQEFPAYTSWGLTTRSIGALVMSHSDNKGLIIPPKLSEYHAVILALYKNEEHKEAVQAHVRTLGKQLIGEFCEVPVEGKDFCSFVGENKKLLVDFREARFGEKITDFEISGYPVAIAVGAKEIEEEQYTVISRILGEKEAVGAAQLNSHIAELNEK